MPRRVIAFPRDEDVPASPALAHRSNMLPHEVTLHIGRSCARPLRATRAAIVRRFAELRRAPAPNCPVITMRTKARIVRIGNSMGIRFPKALLDEAGRPEDLELHGEPGRLIVQAARRSRSGWTAAAKRMRARGDDRLDGPVATKVALGCPPLDHSHVTSRGCVRWCAHAVATPGTAVRARNSITHLTHERWTRPLCGCGPERQRCLFDVGRCGRDLDDD